jgi:hypothetical protein
MDGVNYTGWEAGSAQRKLRRIVLAPVAATLLENYVAKYLLTAS